MCSKLDFRLINNWIYLTSRAKDYNTTLSPTQANKVSILFLINTLKIYKNNFKNMFFKKEITAWPNKHFFANH